MGIKLNKQNNMEQELFNSVKETLIDVSTIKGDKITQ
jgi:hypothetical protein